MSDTKRPPRDTIAYGDDLAYIHDAGYAGFALGAAPGLLRLLRQRAITAGRVVDLGCGGGIWAEQLAQAGYRVEGVDRSPAMIALARRRVPAAAFHEASLCDFPLPRCRAITALGEVVCYRAEAKSGRRALASWFRRAYQALEPGGLLVFDVAERGLDRDRPAAAACGADWACLVRFEYDERRDHLLRHITAFRQTGTLYRRSEETHRVELFDRQELLAPLRAVGFRVATTRRFGEFPLLPGRLGFVAQRPGK